MTHALIVFTLSSSFPTFQQTASMNESFPMIVGPGHLPSTGNVNGVLTRESLLLISK